MTYKIGEKQKPNPSKHSNMETEGEALLLCQNGIKRESARGIPGRNAMPIQDNKLSLPGMASLGASFIREREYKRVATPLPSFSSLPPSNINPSIHPYQYPSIHPYQHPSILLSLDLLIQFLVSTHPLEDLSFSLPFILCYSLSIEKHIHTPELPPFHIL